MRVLCAQRQPLSAPAAAGGGRAPWGQTSEPLRAGRRPAARLSTLRTLRSAWAGEREAPASRTVGSDGAAADGAAAGGLGAAKHTEGEPNIVPFRLDADGVGPGALDSSQALFSQAEHSSAASWFGGQQALGERGGQAPPGGQPLPSSWPSEAARQSLYSDVPVDRVDGLHTKVLGKLPAWLRGSFYRNGPGMFGGAHAVFDGCAMMVRFRVEGSSNEVVLSHRFLETTYYRAAKAQGNIKWKMAHPPAAGPRSTLQGLAYAGGMALGALQYGQHLGDNAVVSIVPQGHELIAHTETLSGTYRVHPETLETLGRVEYRDDIHGLIKTAHQNFLPNGDLVGVAADFAPVRHKDSAHLHGLKLPEITVFRQSPWQVDRRHKLAAVEYMRPTHPTWIHEVPVSEHYAVVVQNPIFYNVRALVMGQAAEYLAFDWRPEYGSLLHVVPLLGGEVKTYRAPAFLAVHWVNAFESADGRQLHLDGVVGQSPELMAHYDLDTVRAGPERGKQIPSSCLRRLTLDLSLPDGSFLEQKPLLQALVPDSAHGWAFELPTIHPGKRCQEHRYVYAACAERPTNAYNALCKLDTLTGEVKMWHEAGGAAWEPIFVPRPGGKAEDDGAVLCTIMQADGRSALLVLDARDWKEVARAVVPYGLPNGFHGCFVPS